MIESLSKLAARNGSENILSDFKRIRAESGLPAAAALVIEKNRILFSAEDGIRKLGSSERVGGEDKWHLGSCTKNLTAFMIGSYVDRGLLTWTDRLQDLVPPNIPIHPAFADVTVEDLLSHRAGFMDVTEIDEGRLWPRLFDPRLTLAQSRELLVRCLLLPEPLFKPGSQSDYSNGGYVILGWILEQKLKRSWEDLTLEFLRERWSIKSAGFGPGAKETSPRPDQPWGHLEDENRLVPVHFDNPPALGPAGTLHCSLSDWAMFLLEVERSARGDSRVLSKQTAAHLFSPIRAGTMNHLSMGMAERDWAQGKVLSMAGSNTMNYFLSLIAPQRGRIIMIAANAGNEAAQQAVVQISKLLTNL